jgi:hypothetical protein
MISRGQENLPASRERFAALVHEMGLRLGQDTRMPDIGTEEADLLIEVSMDDSRFLVKHGFSNPALLSIQCFFGTINTLNAGLPELMALNTELLDQGSAFSLEPESGEVIYGFRMNLAALDATKLLDTLHDVATWREEYTRTGLVSIAI